MKKGAATPLRSVDLLVLLKIFEEVSLSADSDKLFEKFEQNLNA